MIAPGLIEQLPPGDEAVDDPPATDAPAVDTPAEPETVDGWRTAYARLQADNAAMAARLAQFEAPPVENWIELKRAAPTPSKSGCEWLRRRVRAQAAQDPLLKVRERRVVWTR